MNKIQLNYRKGDTIFYVRPNRAYPEMGIFDKYVTTTNGILIKLEMERDLINIDRTASELYEAFGIIGKDYKNKGYEIKTKENNISV